MSILIPVLIVTAIGLVLGLGLALAAKFMSVPTDEREEKIRECLPGANCGACGFSGCDGYAKALVEDEGLDHDAREALHIYAGVLVEAFVLRRYRSIDKIGREVLITYIGAVLYMEGGEHLTVFCKNLCGKLVVRVLKLLERRNLGKESDKQQGKEQYRKRCDRP